jgi:citrate lyase subunit beta / citryl-CoA lyase
VTARSYLFVPASQPDRFAQAVASGADVVILDLEDAIPPDGKNTARAQLAEWLAQGARFSVALRVNAAGTEWFAKDLTLCNMPAVTAVMLPKAASPAHLAEVARAAPGRALLPLIETAAGFERAAALARVAGVDRLVFGSVDFQRDLGIEGDGEELLHFRSGLVLQSRLAGLAAPVDGVAIDIDDEEGLARDATRARRLGFGAKLCIHPVQVPVVHRAFRPSEDELAWATRVVEAAEHARGAVFALDGSMVDKPVILRAHTVLARALRT